jgi:N-acetylneuraminic acid mutarotase
MIVWGGDFVGNPPTGGRYNPSSDSWTSMSTVNAPADRAYYTAVWTGTEMIVWGGYSNAVSLRTGGRYNPSTDTWRATNSPNAPIGRNHHTAVWTGSEMIVWGGQGTGSSNIGSTGGRYNPNTNSWTATNTTNAPTGRAYHTAVWTGSEMIVWGGETGLISVNTGGRYNPGTDSWIATNTINVPAPRFFHTALWTGGEMIIWGGYDFTNDLNTGGRYNPSTDGWTATNSINAPIARDTHTVVWSGSQMIVWGGLASGGRYCAQPPTPAATPTPPPPPTFTVSGTASYCSNPVPGPVPNVTLTLTGSGFGSTLSDASGNYGFSSLASGASYLVTPTKSGLIPGSAGINTVDVIAAQRHFLILGTPLSGCRLTAANVNGDTSIDTVDVIAIQRFFLGLTDGVANVGTYEFSPASRSYSGITSDQIDQNYDTLIFGDVASGFVERPDGASRSVAADGTRPGEPRPD